MIYHASIRAHSDAARRSADVRRLDPADHAFLESAEFNEGVEFMKEVLDGFHVAAKERAHAAIRSETDRFAQAWDRLKDEQRQHAEYMKQQRTNVEDHARFIAEQAETVRAARTIRLRDRWAPYLAILASLLLAFAVFLTITLIWRTNTASSFEVTYDISGMTQALLIGTAALYAAITYARNSGNNNDG